MMTKLLWDANKDYIVCFQNTGRESPGTLNFINECDKRWNLNLVWIEYCYEAGMHGVRQVTFETASRNGEPFEMAINSQKGFLPGLFARYCTRLLKIETLKRYLKSIGITDYTSYNGIRYDEPRRWSKENKDYDIEMPLVKWKVNKADVLDFWKLQDFDLMVNEPYGNCDGCFLKGKGKLGIIAKERPEIFDWWIAQEQRTNNQFRSEISYQDLKNNAQNQLGMWDNDPTFECFCNID
jgi:hypothetical protein